MWFKKHDRILKIAVIGVTLLVALVVFNIELDNQRDSDALGEILKLREIEFAKNKPFYDCILAAAAMANESSPMDEIRAAVEAGDECYRRYNR